MVDSGGKTVGERMAALTLGPRSRTAGEPGFVDSGSWV
jgi:hypothetical protein